MGATRRIALVASLLVLAGFVAFAIGILVPRPYQVSAGDSDAGNERQVLLLSNPIHTDIAFPADPDVISRLSFLEADGLMLDHSALRWIIIGWGGRSFYIETPTWSELKPGPLLKALTIDRSAMHVQLAGTIAPGDNVVALWLSPQQFDAMLYRALARFARNSAGSKMTIANASYGPADLFYEADGYFNALVGCNTWTAGVLRAGGLRTGMWNPVPLSVSWSVRLHNDCSGAGCRPQQR